MSLPKWRVVSYVDEGVYEYECLNCYETLHARRGLDNWQFCPFCGICWEGQHKWDNSKNPKKLYWTAFHEGKLNIPREPLNYLIQEKDIFSSHETDWKDTWHSISSNWYFPNTNILGYVYALEKWRDQVREAEGSLQEDKQSHEQYCEQMKCRKKWSPWHLTHLRLLVKRLYGREKILFTYQPALTVR